MIVGKIYMTLSGSTRLKKHISVLHICDQMPLVYLGFLPYTFPLSMLIGFLDFHFFFQLFLHYFSFNYILIGENKMLLKANYVDNECKNYNFFFFTGEAMNGILYKSTIDSKS